MDCFVVSLLAMTNETRDSTPTLSLRGFKKAAAISGLDIGTVKQNSSLRELLATRGNLSMGYNYSFMEFFFFSVFVFVISGCGLLRCFTPRNDDRN